MTYEEALKARARIAYQPNAFTKMAYLSKKAEDDNQGVVNAGEGDKEKAYKAQELENALSESEAARDAAETKYKNLQYGLGAGGAGVAGGAGIGAAAYGITGLFPSLRKRRLLRALIAIGAGGAGGAGLGYLTYRGLQNGKVQEYGEKALQGAKDAYEWTKDKAQGAYNAVKEKISPTDPNAEAKANGTPYAVPAKEQKD